MQAKKANVNAANATNTANKKAPQSATATANTSSISGGPAPKTSVSNTTLQQAADVQTQKQSQAQTKPPVQNPAHTETKPQPTKAVQNAISNNADLARNKTTNPDIVKNPLTTKISCVPLAKLINSTPEPENDVIIIEELPKEAAKPSETPKNLIPVQATNQNSTIAAKKPTNIAAHPVRLTTTNKVVVRPTYVAPTDYPAARPGGTFESRSQSHVMGLVGVEYVLKIVRNLADKNARYQCCLCEITADEQSMHNHLLGYNHRLKYFDKHFPTAMRLYRQYVSQVPESEVCKIMMPIFDKLAHAIETHHGRKSAHLCYEHVYSKDRQSLFSQVYNRKHSSEKFGPSFTHVVDAKEVEELINRVRNNVQPLMNIENPNPYYVPPYVPHYVGYQNVPEKNTQPPVDDETHKRMVDNFLRDTRHSSGDVHKSRNPKRNRSRSNSPDQRKRVTHKRHWNVERRSVSPLRDGDLWQAYRHMVDHKVRELNMSFDTYKSDPEQHPNYQAEWQMFWKRRKDELILAGINHRTYNFQNEWIHFFNARIEELYNQDIENIKIKCRERLCLPMTNNELADEKYYVHLGKTDEPDLRKPEPRNELQKMMVDEENLVVEPPNVIHVLRLLTALEDYLGSLGPFVTEMLVKALQTQKINPENVHSSILTAENCAILETVKEKFTGLLISQIYDPAKERALKRAINDTELLLRSASKLNHSKDNAQHAEQPDMANKKPYSHDKPLDKTELAAKLASSLMSQGKTSINREELQKILQVYTMIEQKKRQDVPSSSSSINLLPSTSTNLIPNSNSNGNLLTQHSSRNLNIASNAKQPNNPTSMHTGQNYSGNVARFNNQQSTNLASTFTSNAYPTDRGFGGSGGFNSQVGSALPAINPSSVLRNDLTTSSLFNFNTNLNPSYNNPNRRNPNF
uniref:GG12285 n=2 Tax=Drosophila erecta TaxID=7220 RepID=B3P6R7_DROER